MSAGFHLRALLRWATASVALLLFAGLSVDSAHGRAPREVSCPHVALAPVLAEDRNPDGTPVRQRPDARGKYVPIVMVHGWTGQATHDAQRKGAFSGPIDLSSNPLARPHVNRSLIGQLQRVPGAAVYTFDYHAFSARWVDDPHLGPALGEAIDCLYDATGEKVIVVGHSMGGLVARYAVGHPGRGRADRAREVSTVVTFGTPETGSLLADLSATGLDLGATPRLPEPEPLAVLRLMLATCGSAASRRLETGSPCDFLPEYARAFDSDAGRALRAGSAELKALGRFPKGVEVDALAGETTLKVPEVGWFGLSSPKTRDVDVGDLLVTRPSATSGATASKTIRCAYQLNAVRGATDELGLVFRQISATDVAKPIWQVKGPCMHSNLMRTIELTNEATGAISDDIAGRRPVTSEDLLTEPVPSLCEHRPGTLVDGELKGIPPIRGFVALASKFGSSRDRTLTAFGDLNGDGVGDAAAVVSCNRGGVPWGDSVELYAPGHVRLGGVTLTDISDEQGRDYVVDLAIEDGAVNVEWTANRNSDYGCCATRDWSARLAVTGGHLRISDVHSYDETSTARRVIDAIRDGNPSAARGLATPSTIEQLSLIDEDAALGDFECHGAMPIFDDGWPQAAADYWTEWPPPDEDPVGPYGERYCLVDLEGVDVPAILGMDKVGYRRWRAVSFISPGFGHD